MVVDRKEKARAIYNSWSWPDAAVYCDAAPDPEMPNQEMDVATHEELIKLLKAAKYHG